ncbi:MAG: PilZ domain-containing protein [Sphingomicrobium sp.]
MVRTPGMSKRAPRVDVRKAAMVINSDGIEVDATILDVSGSGFRLRIAEKLYIGEFVSLRVDQDLVPAQIRWVLGDEAGGAFLAPVDTGTL